MLMGGVLGLVLGAAAALGTAIALRRMEPREERQRRLRLSADLPVAVDLLAACLRGGASWAAAVEAVADALGGPVADELRGVAAKVKLGADPASAWWALTERPELAALGRTVARAVDSGAALAPALTRLAEDRRRSANAEATARARAVGIRGVAPLGLCFLPAFVLLGLVPVIAGIARDLLPPL
ncbi:type II secretion system (T2SS) protein F [Thermomonospora umbrina]|uniref:Type II secretion system (T2SS) protein F n=2 Tax=Thermomonospora umbrina TaxID=111806 RepID=A0A3D9SMX2_9ACTN|nr:type II secretion system (T2SS) protein F [Thermomonospora umbrina]